MFTMPIVVHAILSSHFLERGYAIFNALIDKQHILPILIRLLHGGRNIEIQEAIAINIHNTYPSTPSM